VSELLREASGFALGGDVEAREVGERVGGLVLLEVLGGARARAGAGDGGVGGDGGTRFGGVDGNDRGCGGHLGGVVGDGGGGGRGRGTLQDLLDFSSSCIKSRWLVRRGNRIICNRLVSGICCSIFSRGINALVCRRRGRILVDSRGRRFCNNRRFFNVHIGHKTRKVFSIFL
jgi:hypothetical protein